MVNFEITEGPTIIDLFFPPRVRFLRFFFTTSQNNTKRRRLVENSYVTLLLHYTATQGRVMFV